MFFWFEWQTILGVKCYMLQVDDELLQSMVVAKSRPLSLLYLMSSTAGLFPLCCISFSNKQFTITVCNETAENAVNAYE